MKKLKLTYLKEKNSMCISRPHYDLHTIEKQPSNIACILTDKTGAKLIRKWIREQNEEK